MEYIAVILKHDRTKPTIERNAVTGESREEVIQAAIAIRDQWLRTSPGPYRIFVGTLSAEVVFPVHYEVKPLEPRVIDPTGGYAGH